MFESSRDDLPVSIRDNEWDRIQRPRTVFVLFAVYDVGDPIFTEQALDLFVPGFHLGESEGVECLHEGVPMWIDVPISVQHLINLFTVKRIG